MALPDKTAITRNRSADLIPGYRLETLIGKGGMGEVHKATQLSLGRTVAVKLLSGDLAKDPAFVARFEKEAAALAALSHPNIVSIVDKGRADGTYYLVMEYVDGPSLREVMRGPLFDHFTALKIGFEICRAIEYAHSRGVFHRDLKPENILFAEQAGGIPKVSDFGLAGFLEGAEPPSKLHVTETHVAMGTAAYMAPEQRVDARSADHRADIYSLGVILYELMVGELPVGNFDPPSHRKPGIDRRIDPIIARCLKPVPADRYQKVSDVIADLEPLVPVTASMKPRKVGRVERMSMVIRRTTKRVTNAAMLLVVAAALIVLGFAALRSKAKPAFERPGEALAATLPDMPLFTAEGRWEEAPDKRTLSLGEGGFEKIPLRSFGRPASFFSKSVNFPLAEKGALVGRAAPDFDDIDGIAISFTADTLTQGPEGGLFQGIKSLFSSETPNPSASLLLLGRPGRFACLSVFSSGAESQFQYSLGDQHNTTVVGPKIRGNTHLELSVDKMGRLHAYVGSDRRAIGEPVPLGGNWKHAFGGAVPRPAIGCVDGACAFGHFHYAVEREGPMPNPRPPEPVVKAPPKAPPPKKPTPVARKPEPKKTVAKKTPR